MRDDHIIQLIDDRSPDKLSAAEIQQIRAHTAHCAECLDVFEAALISTRLLGERAAVAVEPPPFFQTRVLAAIREKNGGNRTAREALGFQKIWQSARILITSMAIVVATLTAVNLYNGRTPFQPGASAPSSGPSSGPSSEVDNDMAATVMFEDDTPSIDEMTFSQVLTNLYDSDAPEGLKPEDTDGRQQ